MPQLANEAELQSLTTEQQNLASQALDTKSALEIATIINDEDRTIAAAVGRALPQIAEAINAIAEALGRGGRLIYIGSGSGLRASAGLAVYSASKYFLHGLCVAAGLESGKSLIDYAAHICLPCLLTIRLALHRKQKRNARAKSEYS